MPDKRCAARPGIRRDLRHPAWVGSQFDIRSFDGEMLSGGVLPLDLLDAHEHPDPLTGASGQDRGEIAPGCFSTHGHTSASRRRQVARSAFPTRKAGSPLAGQRAGLEDWHTGCSGCTGSAPRTRERRHLRSGALELGPCSRSETPNARAGRLSDRIRRTSDSGKGPFSDVPSASAVRTGSLEALKPSVLLLVPLRGALFLQRFLWLLLRLTLAVQTLAHGSLPWDDARLSRSATRNTAPCALPCRHANVHGPKGERCCPKTSTLEAARNLSACLSRPRRTPALCPGQSLTS